MNGILPFIEAFEHRNPVGAGEACDLLTLTFSVVGSVENQDQKIAGTYGERISQKSS
jgi:hypothetical protein